MRSYSGLNYTVIVAAAIGLLLIGCTQTSGSKSPQAGSVQTFVPYKYVDPATGMVAFRLLIPKGWQVEGGVKWSETPALPVKSRFRFYNPDGPEELNFFPARTFCWTNNRMTLSTKPPGSEMFGSTVLQPISLDTAFQSVVIPGANRNTQGMKVLQAKDVPELAEMAKGQPEPGVSSEAHAGKMRIAYHEGGRIMEEEFYAAVLQFIINIPGSVYAEPSFINYWFVDHVFSFRAEKGKLDQNARLFQTMIYSVKIDPKWFAKVVNVKEMLAEQNIKRTQHIGRIGQMIAKAGSEMREDQMREWERNQQAADRIARNQSDTIRGVDRYYDERAGREVELPTGGHAWGNNLGEYFVTESPSYNPNESSGQHWEKLTPVW